MKEGSGNEENGKKKKEKKGLRVKKRRKMLIWGNSKRRKVERDSFPSEQLTRVRSFILTNIPLFILAFDFYFGGKKEGGRLKYILLFLLKVLHSVIFRRSVLHNVISYLSPEEF